MPAPPRRPTSPWSRRPRNPCCAGFTNTRQAELVDDGARRPGRQLVLVEAPASGPGRCRAGPAPAWPWPCPWPAPSRARRCRRRARRPAPAGPGPCRPRRAGRAAAGARRSARRPGPRTGRAPPTSLGPRPRGRRRSAQWPVAGAQRGHRSLGQLPLAVTADAHGGDRVARRVGGPQHVSRRHPGHVVLGRLAAEQDDQVDALVGGLRAVGHPRMVRPDPVGSAACGSRPGPRPRRPGAGSSARTSRSRAPRSTRARCGRASSSSPSWPSATATTSSTAAVAAGAPAYLTARVAVGPGDGHRRAGHGRRAAGPRAAGPGRLARRSASGWSASPDRSARRPSRTWPRRPLARPLADGGQRPLVQQRAGPARHLLEAPDDTEALVLEMGMRGPGQIAAPVRGRPAHDRRRHASSPLPTPSCWAASRGWPGPRPSWSRRCRPTAWPSSTPTTAGWRRWPSRTAARVADLRPVGRRPTSRVARPVAVRRRPCPVHAADALGRAPTVSLAVPGAHMAHERRRRAGRRAGVRRAAGSRGRRASATASLSPWRMELRPLAERRAGAQRRLQRQPDLHAGRAGHARRRFRPAAAWRCSASWPSWTIPAPRTAPSPRRRRSSGIEVVVVGTELYGAAGRRSGRRAGSLGDGDAVLVKGSRWPAWSGGGAACVKGRAVTWSARLGATASIAGRRSDDRRRGISDTGEAGSAAVTG